MSSFIQKIRKAVNKRSTFSFRPVHLQSSDFMQNNVVFADYVVPTDHIKIKPVFEGRCAALTNPSFINTEYHVRGFYVPHSIVWKRFDDFVNGNYTLKDGVHLNTGCPIVTDHGLTNVLRGYSTVVGLSESDIQTRDLQHTYDFIVATPSEANPYLGCILNNAGRFVYKLLRSLGYKINFTYDDANSDQFNAFPLLSYFRVFADYFIPSVFYEKSACNILLSYVYDNSSSNLNISESTEPVGSISVFDLLKSAFDECYRCYYPSDYLVSAWSEPQSPLGTSLDNKYSQNSRFSDIESLFNQSSGVQSTFQNGVQNGVQSSSVSSSPAKDTYGNPWVQRNLQKVADWLTRTRFSGSDKLINILSRFGVKPDNVSMLRAKMVGHFTQPLVVQDVNATATTYSDDPSKDVMLGEYAGKMFTQAQDNRTFEFNCDDYGCIIITSMITPADINYYDGISRNVLKTQPLDWFQPEFDSMGTQLISRRELISGLPFDIPQMGLDQWKSTNTYGYVPRYSEYKRCISNISGDFMVNHLNEGYDSYHHMRSMFKIGRFSANGSTVQPNTLVPDTGPQDDINTVSLANNPELLSSNRNLLIKAQDANQYNRIFNVQNNTIDHIYTMYYFNITASRPMGSIADSIDLEDGSDDKIDTAKPVVENFK